MLITATGDVAGWHQRARGLSGNPRLPSGHPH
jgi:hypothetical protein